MPEMTGYELLKKIKVFSVSIEENIWISRYNIVFPEWFEDFPMNWYFFQESSVLKDIPVVVMSSENIPTRIDK